MGSGDAREGLRVCSFERIADAFVWSDCNVSTVPVDSSESSEMVLSSTSLGLPCLTLSLRLRPFLSSVPVDISSCSSSCAHSSCKIALPMAMPISRPISTMISTTSIKHASSRSTTPTGSINPTSHPCIVICPSNNLTFRICWSADLSLRLMLCRRDWCRDSYKARALVPARWSQYSLNSHKIARMRRAARRAGRSRRRIGRSASARGRTRARR